MASKITSSINYQNIKNIRSQINGKKNSAPFYATTEQAVSVLTDYDTFPYPRYFRGEPQSTRPIVAERESGWRPRHDNCYKSHNISRTLYPNHCFQVPCSTVLPCCPGKEYMAMGNNCPIYYR